MKRKTILLAAAALMLVSVLAGCRKTDSESGASSGSGAAGTVSQAVSETASKAESAGREFTSAVSGVISETVSKAESTGKEITSAVSGVISGAASAVSGMESGK